MASRSRKQSISPETRPSGARRGRPVDESSAMRDRILRAAADVFLEKGVDGFSMRLVASRVGYSATTIYHHFVNKEDLLKAILDDVFSEFAETMRRAYEEESDPARRMGALGKAHVRFGLAHPVHYQLMYRSHPDWILDGSRGASEAYRRGYEMLLQGAREGIEAGFLPPADPRVLADWMLATIHGLVMLGIGVFHDDPQRLEAALSLFDLHVQSGASRGEVG